MINDPNWAKPAAVADHFQHSRFLVTFADVQDFLPALVAVFDHAIEIDAQQIRLYAAEHFREARYVGMAMMKIVDDADIRDAIALQSLNDLNLVVGFSEPAAMVVKADLAAQARRRLRDWAHARGFSVHAGALFYDRVLGRRTRARHPKLRSDSMPLDDF